MASPAILFFEEYPGKVNLLFSAPLGCKSSDDLTKILYGQSLSTSSKVVTRSRYAKPRKSTIVKVDMDKVDVGSKDTESDDLTCQIFLPRRNGAVQIVIPEETREDVKHGSVYRSGFSGSAESNTSHRNDNCIILALNMLICFMYCCSLI